MKQRGRGSKFAQHFGHIQLLLQPGINAQIRLCVFLYVFCLTLGSLISIYTFTPPKGQSCPLKAPPLFVSFLLGCLETTSSVRDAEEGRSLRRGAEHKRTSPTLTSSVSNTTDQGRRWAIPYPADCESFGNVPCLCEYHHLISAGGLIRNSLMGWAVAPVLWDNQS